MPFACAGPILEPLDDREALFAAQLRLPKELRIRGLTRVGVPEWHVVDLPAHDAAALWPELRNTRRAVWVTVPVTRAPTAAGLAT